MAVRFLPAPEDQPIPVVEERENLAEVIEFRSRLKRPEPQLPRAQRAAAVLDAATRAVASSAPSVTESASDAAGASAYDTAVKLLARKAMSSGELLRALGEAGCSSVDAESAVAECEAALYLDDAGLAASVTHKLRDAKGASQAVIRRKLHERLLPDAAIEAALAELDADEELELLTRTAADRARRLEGLDRQTAERRLLGFLARRGWTGERAMRAAKDALNGVGNAPRQSVRFRSSE